MLQRKSFRYAVACLALALLAGGARSAQRKEHGAENRPGVTMESLRTWRFKPAQFEGKPVPVYYTLTINYSVQQCHEAQRWGWR
jgi:hypothetical protein